MKRSLLLLFALLVALLLVPTAAYAINYSNSLVHGNFANNSKGCASCHVTHAAKAAKLLRYGENQSSFCFYCHGGTMTSWFDVEEGKVETEDDVSLQPSYAGGFVTSYDFGDSNAYESATSIHNVETMTASSPAGTTLSSIPGGTGSVAEAFKCGSCHDPHKGGTYPETGVKNARLLKTTLLGNVNVAVMGDWNISNSSNASGTNRVIQYGTGISAWCGGCHNKFDTNDDSGHTADGYGKYRHAMEVNVTADASFTPSVSEVATDTAGQLHCLSCHRAHGSAADVSGMAAWDRDNGGTSTSSVLLRLKQRDVCYQCHGAAQRNKP